MMTTYTCAMTSHSTSAASAEAASFCAHFSSAIIAILDAIIMASIIIFGRVNLAGLRNFLALLVLVLLVVLFQKAAPTRTHA